TGAGDQDRPAEVAAGIVELALRLLRPGDAVGAVVRRELIVAVVIVDRAAEAGAAPRHARGSELGGEVRALDLHFLNHVVVQRDDHPAVRPDVDQAGAIELHAVGRTANAVHRVTLRVVRTAAEAHALHG